MTASEYCRDELQVLAAALEASLTESLSPDQQAYAALVQDGELHPWTKRAEDVWNQAAGSDPWRDHHLAIVHHAKAYDLESTGSPEAFRHWSLALRHWSVVHADSTFWTRMARHLAEVGAEVAPDVIDGVRARLPQELLQPHRDLIAAYQASDPQRARSHLRVLTSAPFEPGLIDSIRLELTGEVLDAVPGEVKTGDFDGMIERLLTWQHIDEHNAHLLRALLYVYRKFNELNSDAEDSLARVAENVAAADRTLQDFGVPPPDPAGVSVYIERLKALRPSGLPAGALAAEIARHEAWRGLTSYRLASRGFSWKTGAGSRQECERCAAKAVQHFAVARQLDPNLGLDSYYSALSEIEADVESLWGLCLMARDDLIGAAQHCRRATTLDPSDPACFLGLAQALLMPDNVMNAALAEAEHAISQADSLLRESGDRSPAEVAKLRELLTIRRASRFRR